MRTAATGIRHVVVHPVDVLVEPSLANRNRLTAAFRPILALPHLLLVGAPFAGVATWIWNSDGGGHWEWGAGGALGAVAALTAVIAWFAIVFTGRHPPGLWSLAAFYLRWRVRALAYAALLRDEFPPFEDRAYPATLALEAPQGARDRPTVAFRIFLALPHLFVLWALGVAWGITTVVAWLAILSTGRYPAPLYEFAVDVLRWHVRVEAYLLLLRDEYPPFSFA